MKPCAAEALEPVISRACRLRELLQNATVRGLVGGIGDLPPVPSTFNKVTLALSDPERPLAEVAALIEQDIAMSAKILQLVNSSFIGVGRPMTSLGDGELSHALPRV